MQEEVLEKEFCRGQGGVARLWWGRGAEVGEGEEDAENGAGFCSIRAVFSNNWEGEGKGIRAGCCALGL